jgi:hypothetical protein
MRGDLRSALLSNCQEAISAHWITRVSCVVGIAIASADAVMQVIFLSSFL